MLAPVVLAETLCKKGVLASPDTGLVKRHTALRLLRYRIPGCMQMENHLQLSAKVVCCVYMTVCRYSPFSYSSHLWVYLCFCSFCVLTNVYARTQLMIRADKMPVIWTLHVKDTHVRIIRGHRTEPAGIR